MMSYTHSQDAISALLHASTCTTSTKLFEYLRLGPWFWDPQHASFRVDDSPYPSLQFLLTPTSNVAAGFSSGGGP